MHLADVLPKIQTGDLLFFQGRALFSRVIRCWTGQPYSHVATVLRVTLDGNGEVPCVFESMEHAGVRLLPLPEYIADRAAHRERVVWRPITDPALDRQKFVAHLRSTWGESYSSPLQFIWSFGVIARWIRGKLGLPVALDPRRPFCSWEVTEALNHAGWQSPKAPAETTPGDVFEFSCLGPPEELTP